MMGGLGFVVGTAVFVLCTICGGCQYKFLYRRAPSTKRADESFMSRFVARIERFFNSQQHLLSDGRYTDTLPGGDYLDDFLNPL